MIIYIIFIGFHAPERSVTNCTVLEIEAPDDQLLHGHAATFYVRASKSVIIQNPKVVFILKNGSIIQPSKNYSLAQFEKTHFLLVKRNTIIKLFSRHLSEEWVELDVILHFFCNCKTYLNHGHHKSNWLSIWLAWTGNN